MTNIDQNGVFFQTEIDGHDVTFEGYISDGYLAMVFTVDYTLERLELPGRTKLAITKWLLQCWKETLPHFDKFMCCATNDDGTGWRAKLYRKLGFIEEEGAMVYYK